METKENYKKPAEKISWLFLVFTGLSAMTGQTVRLDKTIPQFGNHGEDLIDGSIVLPEIGFHSPADKIIIQRTESMGYFILTVQGGIQMPQNPLGPLQSIIGLSIFLLTVILLECAELFDQFIKQTGQHFTRSHCHHRLLLIFLIWIERHILSPFCHYIELNCCDSHEL